MDQFITCNGLDCTLCSLLQTVSGVFRWLLGISAVIAVLVLVISGLIYILNSGSKRNFFLAKRSVVYSVYGFIFALIAFVAVHTSIWLVGGTPQKNWWKFECSVNNDIILSDNNVTTNKIATKTDSRLATEIEDEAPILTNVASLNRLADSKSKIAVFNTENLNAQNLRQDLLNLGTGTKIRFLAGAKSGTPEELAAFTAMENGFINKLTSQYRLAELSKKFHDSVSLSRDDGDLTIDTGENVSSLSGSYWGLDPELENRIDQIIKQLLLRTTQNVIAYKNARSEGSLNECVDTGGEWKEFPNECTARKQIYGKQSIRCSDIENPAMGCQCPEGNYLTGGVCIKKEDLSSQSTIKKQENPDLCSGKVLIDRTCPATRCEGSNLVHYPDSGADQCVNGAYKEYSCEATGGEYNATCDQMKNLTDETDKENLAKQDPNTYNRFKIISTAINPKIARTTGVSRATTMEQPAPVEAAVLEQVATRELTPETVAQVAIQVVRMAQAERVIQVAQAEATKLLEIKQPAGHHPT